VGSDSISPVSSEAKANGTITTEQFATISKVRVAQLIRAEDWRRRQRDYSPATILELLKSWK
jgi:hypothetical protein